MVYNENLWDRMDTEHPHPNDIRKCINDLRAEIEEQREGTKQIKTGSSGYGGEQMSLSTAWNAAIAIIEGRYRDARDILRPSYTRGDDYAGLQARLISAVDNRVRKEIGISLAAKMREELPKEMDKEFYSILVECLKLAPGNRAKDFTTTEEAYYTGVSDVEVIIESRLSGEGVKLPNKNLKGDEWQETCEFGNAKLEAEDVKKVGE
jgi:hypothetical protein